MATLDLKVKGIGLHVVTPVKNLGITSSKDSKKVKDLVGMYAKTYALKNIYLNENVLL